MKKVVLTSSLLGVALLAVLVASTAFAHGDNGGGGKASLSGYQETPLTLSTTGHGSFRVKVRRTGSTTSSDMRISRRTPRPPTSTSGSRPPPAA